MYVYAGTSISLSLSLFVYVCHSLDTAIVSRLCAMLKMKALPTSHDSSSA